MDHRKRGVRILTVFITVMTTGVLLLGPLAENALAQPAELPGKGAGGPGLPVAIGSNLPDVASSAYNNVITQLTRAGVVAFFNALQVFFGQLAYDAANYIAAGGKGQAANFYKKGFGQYLGDVAKDASGEFIGSISQDFFRTAGIDLCAPSNPLTTLRIQLSLGAGFPGLNGKFSRPAPKCTFKSITENWDNLFTTLSNTDVWSSLSHSFDINGNDLGVSVSIFGQSIFKQSAAKDAATLTRNEGQGFKAVENVISGNVKTPGQVVGEETKEVVNRNPKATQLQMTGSILSTAFQSGPIQLLQYTASVFINTLASKMLKRIFEKGLAAFDFSDLETQKQALGADSIVTSSKTDSRKANIDLRTPRLQRLATFELVSDLIACPTELRGLWNCAVDQALGQAINTQGDQGGVTVQEAIAKNLLHSDWKLIPSTMTKENQDPLCYTYGYCVSNLRKLRAARILPVGFELAADAPANVTKCAGAGGCITLGEVINNFSSCNPDTGELDAEHPWCHLIDPNWVITSMPQQCMLSGFGDTQLSATVGQRKEECQDIQTCLQRNDKGECVGGYGYCVADKTVYRFKGQECLERNASCRTYQTKDDQTVSYLRNTLDYAQCSADNAGCLWYATERNPSLGENGWQAGMSTGSKMYFNSKLEACSADDEGCTKLYAAQFNQSSLNLLLNPSFENLTTDTPAKLAVWLPSEAFTAPTVTGGTAASQGSASAPLVAGGRSYSQGVDMAPRRTYTISFYARNSASSGGTLTTLVSLFRDTSSTSAVPPSEMGRDFRSDGCSNAAVPPGGVGSNPFVTVPGTELSSGWKRFECTFVTTSSTRSAVVQISGSGALVDGVQLEEGEFSTPFIDGINRSLAEVHLKVAPDDLLCNGLATDSPLCDKFAKVCRQVESGCEGYRAAGGPEVPAIVRPEDICPASCVGYAEYRKQRSAFDLVHDVDTRFDDPSDATSSYFIASTAGQCKQADVGCEQFTNVESGAAGEQSAYFSYVRACEKPSADSETFFTWEGSESAGFQLRTWSLMRGIPAAPPAPPPPSNVVTNSSFELVTGGNLDGWTDAAGTTPVPFTPTPVSAGTAAFDGANALGSPTRGTTVFAWQNVPVAASRTFALSFYARTNDPSAGTFSAIATLYQYDASHTVVPATGLSSGCFAATGDARLYQSSSLTTAWQRFECRFQAASTAVSGALNVVANNTLIDSVSLLDVTPPPPLPPPPVSGPRILVKLGPDQSTFKEPDTCNEATWRTGLDQDCRQFYDAAGNVFYRYFSQTVLSTNDCQTFRMDRSSQADCEKTGGTFNAGTAECFYKVYQPESRTCSATGASCRAYSGSGAGNVLDILSESFRTGLGRFRGGDLSNEALLVGDHSLRLFAPATPGGMTLSTSVVVEGTSAADLFRVSFWAKAPAPSATGLILTTANPNAPTQTINIGTVQLTSDWQRYTVGLFNGTSDATSTRLTWSVRAPASGISVYLDEVHVQKVQDVVYVKANSWVTPAECDRSLAGAPQPQAMLGCTAYTSRHGQTVNVRQFSSLCRESAIGCGTFVDTRNSDAVGAQTFTESDRTPQAVLGSPGQVYGTAVTTRGADRFLYLIDDPSKRCRADNDSCRAFGLPKFRPDRQSIERFTTVYYKDDITRYDQALCKPSEIFCNAFAHGSATEYFRSPDTHACEYKENVRLETGDVPGVGAGNYVGWFQINSSIPCYANQLSSGNNFLIMRVGDGAYQGWGGICPAEEAECTEFRDTNDTSDPLHRTGKPYFFVRNAEFDTTSCAGNIDIGKGCILLRDMSDTTLKYNTAASYEKYRLNGFNPTPPVDCLVNQNDPACSQTRYCHGIRTVRSWSGGGLLGGSLTLVQTTSSWDGPSCRTDADCNYCDASSGTFCSASTYAPGTYYSGSCSSGQRPDDANLLVKVNVDRDCAQWLGCKSAEAVYDASRGRYRDVCTNVALCDKASAQTGDIFCANYVNRSSTSTEKILTQGAFFDAALYASRRTGLGEKDYDGYAIPNSFQVPDLMSARVGAEGAGPLVPDSSGLALDYRLAAAVRIPVVPMGGATGQWKVPEPSNPYQARILWNGRELGYSLAQNGPTSPLATRYAQLSLCQQVQSGIVGYYRKDDYKNARTSGQPFYCYLPVRADSDVYNFQNVAQKFALANPGADAYLTSAFPQPECRAYPEADSPYSQAYVVGWDFSKNPPRPTGKIHGYTNVTTCEQGEECSCTYKRADYQTSVKFYNINSSNAPAGLCQGGPRDGQACLPESVFKLPVQEVKTAEGKTAVRALEGSNAAQTCGDPSAGGRCVPLNKLEIVSGVFGQCLERDLSRIVAGDQSQHPCLTWNPTPVLFGEKDQFHFTPSAGYLPPQNAGQYYCTSYARKPTTIRLNANFFVGPPYAGLQQKLDYDDDFTSDARYVATQGNAPGAQIEGRKPEGSTAAGQCEDIDQEEDDDNQQFDPNGLRLIGSGRTLGTSYVETFYRINTDNFARWMFNSAQPTREQVETAMYDTNIAYIGVRPIVNPNGKGRLLCAYQPDWVDGLGHFSTGDADQVAQKDQEWQDKFLENFSTVLTRGTEKLFTNNPSGDGNPWPMNCVRTSLNNDPNWSSCYFKTWELGYRNDNQKEFVKLFGPDDETDQSRAPIRTFMDINRTPVYDRCTADKPYFSIRAVFQANAEAQSSSNPADLTKDNIQGPWRFVGFWVTTCAGQANDDRYIYMNFDVFSADICKELAEVRSRDSLQDAAFTDRVWSQGSFIVPGVGTQYNTRSSPFSSALNTKPAGKDPLFQTGSDIAGVSRLKPPTWISSGNDTYFRDVPDAPKDKWAYLTNLFARVYRVYRFYQHSVTKTDFACTSGPFKGAFCNQTTSLPNSRKIRRPDGSTTGLANNPACSIHGLCQTNVLSAEELANLRYCNAFSGINSGQACGSNLDICHTGAIQASTDTSGRVQIAPKLLPCEISKQGSSANPAWKKMEGTNVWSKCTDAGCTTVSTEDGERNLSTQEAGRKGAFRCAVGSVNRPTSDTAWNNSGFCSSPSSASVECPAWVKGTCTGSGSTPGRCTNVQVQNGAGEWRNLFTGGVPTDLPACYSDRDCSFTDLNFYFAGPSYTPDCHGGGTYLADGTPASPGSLGCPHGPGAVYSRRSWSIQDNSCTDATPDQTGLCLTHTLNTNDNTNPSNDRLLTVITKYFHSDGTVNDPPNSDNTIAAWYKTVTSTRLEESRFPGVQEDTSSTDGVREALLSAFGDVARFFGDSPRINRPLAACDPPAVQGGAIGRCAGGVFEGRVCLCSGGSGSGTNGYCTSVAPPSGFSCYAEDPARPGQIKTEATDQCTSVSNAGGTAPLSPQCVDLNQPGPYTSEDPDTDNNICTHGQGYYPRLDVCPDPSDEFCGLIAYKVDPTASGGSLNPDSDNPLPTDVTFGHYTPRFLGFNALPATRYGYISYYTPRPPRIAAPDARNCATPGQCPIQRLDGFNFNGQSEGTVSAVGGQQKSTLRFYAWADHNQMPLRSITVDWGDSSLQELPDARLKNHKPFCGVQKECSDPQRGAGITCQTDSDCPPGAGSCLSVGSCDKKPNIVCHTDNDCRSTSTDKDVCKIRTFFGNDPGACDPNYFEFSHLYTCPGPMGLPSCRAPLTGTAVRFVPANECYFGASDNISGDAYASRCNSVADCNAAWIRANGGSVPSGTSCGQPTASGPTTEARCSRDPARTCDNAAHACAPGDTCIDSGLAPPGGCWDETANACRFTPRVMTEDNWGWCTGECRTQEVAGTMEDGASTPVKHPYGGCWSGTTRGSEKPEVRTNLTPSTPILGTTTNQSLSECKQSLPSSGREAIRPWIVYPGSLQLRSSGELTATSP